MNSPVEALSGGMAAEDWMAEGECRKRGLPTSVFFPSRGDPDIWAAMECCASCPVMVDCLRYRVENPPVSADDDGIWGGTSGRDRRVLRRAVAAGKSGLPGELGPYITLHVASLRYALAQVERHPPSKPHLRGMAISQHSDKFNQTMRFLAGRAKRRRDLSPLLASVGQ